MWTRDGLQVVMLLRLKSSGYKLARVIVAATLERTGKATNDLNSAQDLHIYEHTEMMTKTIVLTYF